MKLAVSPLLIAASLFLISIAGADEPPTSAALACPPGLADAAEGCALAAQDQAPGTWDLAAGQSAQALFDRATGHDLWMRQHLMPAGGVMPAYFTDASLGQVQGYDGRRDPAIWTGAYLAAQALRLKATGAADARTQVHQTVQVLDRWWRISGDPGYLARFAAPANSPSAILDTLPASDPEVIRNVPFNNQVWHWRGRVSRDQYQGVLLGMSLAYEATSDPAIRRMIRENVTRFAEQLMRRESRRVKVVINGARGFTLNLSLQHVVYSDDETPDGLPILNIRTNPLAAEGSGMLVFWPNTSEALRQIPGLGGLPDVPVPAQAIQLASAFQVAMQVTAGVPGYEARHAALRAHYEEHFDAWFDIASGWENTNTCGGSYHGLNTAFMPLYNWIRLEQDPTRRARLQEAVLRDALWAEVADHNNVLFAFIYAAQAAPEDAVDEVIATHLAQLGGFPDAPQRALPLDVRWKYPEDPRCPGLAATATDVADRPAATFIWERQPWVRFAAGTPNLVYPGVDYLLAYWLGRQSGFLEAGAKLTLARSGTGVGKVTSNPAGINCGTDCGDIYPLGRSVTLTATPATGSGFAGWSGACSGQARTCTLAMTTARSVTANFVPLTIKINDITLTEGHSSLKTFAFRVSLSGLGSGSVKVNYATANGTAQAGTDYLASYGTLTFGPNETQKTIGIRVKGDTLKEGHETFLVNLRSPTGARLIDSQGKGTVTNDD